MTPPKEDPFKEFKGTLANPRSSFTDLISWVLGLETADEFCTTIDLFNRRVDEAIDEAWDVFHRQHPQLTGKELDGLKDFVKRSKRFRG